MRRGLMWAMARITLLTRTEGPGREHPVQEGTRISRNLLPTCQFAIDKTSKELTVENYQNPWKLVDVLDRSKN
jgi:hypothetical protein